MDFVPFPFWSLFFFLCCVVAVVAAIIAVSFVLGQRHRGRVTGAPYESGMPLTESPALRFDIKYYLVAMLFVIFDAEALFMFSWAVAARDLGTSGYIGIVIFIAILMVALAYLWRIGALNWGGTGQARDRGRNRGVA